MASLRHHDSERSSFSLERSKSRGALTILPRSEARFFPKDSPSHSGDVSTPMSPGPGKLKHAIESRSSSLRSNMTTQERLSQGHLQPARPGTPSPNNTPTGKHRIASSTFGSLFRRRVRSKPLRTVTTPTTHWRPFEVPMEEPSCSPPWDQDRQRLGGAKEQRAVYFKQKVERDESERRASRGSRDECQLRPKSSRESLIDIKTAIDNYPGPSMPDAPTYKDKKPQGLAVETTMANRLRKPQSVSSGLRTAFRRGVRRASLSKIVVDEEEK
ncbi:hypothetical protein ACO1O0_007477 [Amphichorda felina]